MPPQPAVRPLGPASGAASTRAAAPASSPHACSSPASTLICLQPHRCWWTVLHSCLHHCCTAVPPLPRLLPLSLALLLAPFQRLPLPAAPPARNASTVYSCVSAASSIAPQLSPSVPPPLPLVLSPPLQLPPLLSSLMQLLPPVLLPPPVPLH